MATTQKKHRILPRDIEAYVLGGRFLMLTRLQLKRWLFADVTEAMVTRFLTARPNAANSASSGCTATTFKSAGSRRRGTTSS